jgi:hypothetical protein
MKFRSRSAPKAERAGRKIDQAIEKGGQQIQKSVDKVEGETTGK